MVELGTVCSETCPCSADATVDFNGDIRICADSTANVNTAVCLYRFRNALRWAEKDSGSLFS